MLSAILLILSIAGVIANSAAGLHSAKAQPFGVTGLKGKRQLALITGSLAFAVLLLNGSGWLVQHLSHRPTLRCLAHFQRAANLPNCTVWGITINPTESIKSLHLIVHFDQPISGSVLAKIVDVGIGSGTGPHTEIDLPCKIFSTPADRDNALTFQLSSDRHEIIVNGHDFSAYDAQSFIVTFYPDPESGMPAHMDVRGEATYERLGHELEANLELTDPISHQTEAISDESGILDSRTVKGLLDSLGILGATFWPNLLGILGVIVSTRQAWPSGSRGKSEPKRRLRDHLLRAGSALVAISMLLLTGSKWIERRLSHTPSVLCSSFMNSQPGLPNCTVWGVAVVPTEPIRDFHLVVTFPQPITDSVVQNGEETGRNFRVQGATEIGPPCNLHANPSDRNESLTFSISSDRRQVIVSGHDVTPYDSQTFLAGFYPETEGGKLFQDLQIKAGATYEAYGHDLPADIHFLKVEKDGVTEVRLAK